MEQSFYISLQNIDFLLDKLVFKSFPLHEIILFVSCYIKNVLFKIFLCFRVGLKKFPYQISGRNLYCWCISKYPANSTTRP